MSESTKIQWTATQGPDGTWHPGFTHNPWIGCSRVHEGCVNCYAENLMDTRYHRVQWGPQGTRSRTKDWSGPPRWNRQAAAEGVRRKVFCASLADVFEDRAELTPWRADLFRLIDATPNLLWLLLTKRPENIRRMWEGENRANVWLGTSVSTQRSFDEFVPRLLSARGLGPILFVSVEPQLGYIDASRFLSPCPVIDWVIAGGESQQGGPAREFNLDWARGLRDQCREARIPFFFKQAGSAPYDLGPLEPDSVGERPIGRIPLRLRDGHGGNAAEWPEDLRVRECPETYYPTLEPSAA